jgi:hypothetical protein
MGEEAPKEKTRLQTLSGSLAAVAGAVTAIAAIVASIFPALDYVKGLLHPAATALVCATQPIYPAGRWTMRISKDVSTPAEYANFATFTDPAQGTWLPAEGVGAFTASTVPRPGAHVTITFRMVDPMHPDQNYPYRSINDLVVSADGCQMEGTFQDTASVRGYVVWSYPVASQAKTE